MSIAALTNGFTTPWVPLSKLVDEGVVKLTGNGGVLRRLLDQFSMTVIYGNIQHGSTHKHYNLEREHLTRFEAIHVPTVIALQPKLESCNIIGAFFWAECTRQHPSRSIPKHIRQALKGNPCNICGARKNIEVDHRKYNGDMTLENFQPLCQMCNKVKREDAKRQEVPSRRHSYYKDVIKSSKSDPAIIGFLDMLDLPKKIIETYEYVSPSEQSGVCYFYEDPRRVRNEHLSYLLGLKENERRTDMDL